MLSLPAWLESRARWSGASVDGRPVLASGQAALDQAQRDDVDRRLADFAVVLAPERHRIEIDGPSGPVEVDPDEAKVIFVTRFLLSLSAQRMTDEQAAARGESYLWALRDVPAWSVEAAMRRWWDGAVPGIAVDDFKWVPSAHDFRRAVDAVLAPWRRCAMMLRAVRDAVPFESVATTGRP